MGRVDPGPLEGFVAPTIAITTGVEDPADDNENVSTEVRVGLGAPLLDLHIQQMRLPY